MKTNRWAVKAAGAGTLALLLAASAFAQSRGDWRGNNSNRDRAQPTQRDDRGGNRADNRSYRDNERVALQGRVSSFNRERDGYRVRLDRGNESFWVPQSYFGRRNVRVGVSIGLGGVFRGGQIYVDAVNWPADGAYNDPYYNQGYNNGYVRGVVDRVDYRSGVAWLRDDASGRVIEADLRSVDRSSRLDARDLRPGDYVELSGGWVRGNVFAVYQIDTVRNGRY